MKWILLASVMCVGMLQPIQAGLNAEFRRHADHPLQAGGLNMLVGAAFVLLLLAIMRVPMPSGTAFSNAPWWSLLGGIIGGTLVMTMLIAAPKLGAALLIGSFVLGQLLSSAIIDHRGLVGYPVQPLSWLRAAGIALLFIGVVLIERGGRA
ncbi:MAG: DMT family transporter [Planctomycetota bacterium]